MTACDFNCKSVCLIKKNHCVNKFYHSERTTQFFFSSYVGFGTNLKFFFKYDHEPNVKKIEFLVAKATDLPMIVWQKKETRTKKKRIRLCLSKPY